MYSMREKQQEKDKPHSQAPGQEASLDPSPRSGIAPPSILSPLVSLLDESNILIAIRKGVRSCTQHHGFKSRTIRDHIGRSVSVSPREIGRAHV